MGREVCSGKNSCGFTGFGVRNLKIADRIAYGE